VFEQIQPSMTSVAPDAESSPYDRLGGEKVLRKLVQRFYQKMDQLADASVTSST
jgi:truncated hemoglobin YjbI